MLSKVKKHPFQSEEHAKTTTPSRGGRSNPPRPELTRLGEDPFLTLRRGAGRVLHPVPRIYPQGPCAYTNSTVIVLWMKRYSLPE